MSDTITFVSNEDFARAAAEASAKSDEAWQRRLNEFRLFYGERIDEHQIA